MSTTRGDGRSRTCAKCGGFRQFSWDSHDPELRKLGQDGLICSDCRAVEDKQVTLK